MILLHPLNPPKEGMIAVIPPSFLLHLLLFLLPTALADFIPQHDFISIITTAPPLTSFAGATTNYRATSHEFLGAHNTARAAVGERPFVWDRQLARFAKRWSDQLRGECRIQHSMGPYGENLFWGSGWSWTAADAVKEWAQEQLYYNVVDNSCVPDQLCGHYTQIIWNSTLRLGCGRSECSNGGGVIITCSYDPPGNYVGENPLTH